MNNGNQNDENDNEKPIMKIWSMAKNEWLTNG